MLTVRYDRLGLRPGDRVLDLGCGAGRHAYESMRRGATVIALDASDSELKDVAGTMAALIEQGEGPGGGGVVNGDGLHLPFPDSSFDRIIAAEVLEHIPADTGAIGELARVLRPGGTMAVTVPRFGPELVNWVLSDAYHSVEGGHVRIYRRSALGARLAAAGLRVTGSHHAHALHTPYWWLRCAVGVDRADHPVVSAYHRLLVWDIVSAPPVTRVADRLLNPLMGKSLVVYVEKPA
ncbi:MAG TPA: methyltransferase domain-containing protein [Acidimicrobiales bacterium]|nr:methyltransferase domain-containing protein [Acidimicrobiales bacterium]